MEDVPNAPTVAYSWAGYGSAMEIDDPDQPEWQPEDSEMDY